MQIMKDLHKEGRTVILITHDNEIAAQADRVIKIKDGQIESDSLWQQEEQMTEKKEMIEGENFNEEEKR